MRREAAFIVCLLTGLAGVQAAPAVGQTVNVLGCVSRGVEFGCLIIKDRRTGKTYQINAANPPPDPAKNLVVSLKGQIFEGVDFCQQGPILKEITWNYTRMACRLGK
jgi:hypothetical protein